MPVPSRPALTSALTCMACFDSEPRADHGRRAGRGVAALMFSLEDVLFIVISVIIEVRPL